MKYKVKYFNHISGSDYTLDQAKELVEYLNITFKGCNAHMIELIDEDTKAPFVWYDLEKLKEMGTCSVVIRKRSVKNEIL